MSGVQGCPLLVCGGLGGIRNPPGFWVLFAIRSALLLCKSRLTPSGFLSGATLEKAGPKLCIGFAVLLHSLGKNETYQKIYFCLHKGRTHQETIVSGKSFCLAFFKKLAEFETESQGFKRF